MMGALGQSSVGLQYTFLATAWHFFVSIADNAIIVVL